MGKVFTQADYRTDGPFDSRKPCRSLLVFCIIAGFLLGSSRAHSQEADLNEYQIKAAFLFNFAKFIEWPEGTYSNAQSPFIVCIFGKDPFGKILDEALAGKSMNNHPVTILRARDEMSLRRCQMVFVSSSESGIYSEILEKVRGASVLLVGETDGFAAAGGMIEFLLEDNHVRFAINPDATRRAGLKCSSSLLALARIVHDAASNAKS
jgi:hypothetical protein